MQIDTKNILNSYKLTDELNRIKTLINKRVYDLRHNYFCNGELVPSIFNNESSLPVDMRILLGLGLAAYLMPQMFLSFLNQQNESFRKLFGGEFRDKKFYPTVQTYIFLMEGFQSQDVAYRKKLLDMFADDSGIYKFIDLVSANKDDYLLDKQVALRKEVISRLVYNKEYSPDYDRDFPANIIKTRMSWDDLVLPFETLESIEEIVNWAEYGDDVLNKLKLGRKLKRGYRALFYGPSGTGKTLTASLIGRKVGKTVYRIDSAHIISKYIGETEKNLERIFEYAEDKNWILFFDEAESLFSKRTATKSSNDRYSNQQVAYLLQRIEDFSGIIILSSNKKGEMDQAFLRRFQLMLEFKIPTVHERLLLWQKGLCEDFELSRDVDLESIAETYEITGGILVNILRTLGVYAIKNKTMVLNQDIILESIKREFNKMGKTFVSLSL